jgi:hypothetical protein
VAIFGQRSAQPESECYLAIGQLADDLASAPIARRMRLFSMFAADSENLDATACHPGEPS